MTIMNIILLASTGLIALARIAFVIIVATVVIAAIASRDSKSQYH